MKSSMLLTLGAIGFALVTAPVAASEDAASVHGATEMAQPVAETAPAVDPVDPMATSEAPVKAAPMADESVAADAAAQPAASAMDETLAGSAEGALPAAVPTEAVPVPAESPTESAETEPAPVDPAQMDPAPMEGAGSVAEGATSPAAPDPFLDVDSGEEAASAEAPATAPDSAPAAEPAVQESEGERLGSVGYDSEGRQGRIHVVVGGDTLWDISDAYLGTPWVWPSIWTDNRGIENPHLIYPGDHIWITRSEMRVVSPEEAARLLSGVPADEASDEMPAAPDTNAEPVFAEDLSPHTPSAPPARETKRVSELEAVGLVTEEDFEAAASIVEAQVERVMLSQGDDIYVGLGAGDVEKGDEFTIFRKAERVFDPDTGRLIGFHVEILGWLQVTDVREEASLAVILQSNAEIERGDRIMPREILSPDIAVMASPEGVEGRISFFAQSRTMMGGVDYVYLNRGTLDGVEAGSPLEVYRPGRVAQEPARHTRVKVPDRVVAELLVIKSEPNSSVAFVSHAATELELGDRFRGASE